MKNKILQISAILIIIAFTNSCCKVDDDTCVENIKDDCACYEIYAPVCGCNGKTYGNDCVAECAGITDYSDGACE